MKDQDQNIAVAKFHGWEKIYEGPEPDDRWMSPDGKYRAAKDIPDYGKDLNAMHQVEHLIMEMKGEHPVTNFPWPYQYAVELSKLGLTGEPAKIHASASQRREALLRTLNLWTEES